MKTITRTVITLDLDAQMLSQGRITIHEALLDGDEGLRIGSKVLVYDGDVTYLSAIVTGHEHDLWELMLQRDAD
jgi:hypothetical protein